MPFYEILFADSFNCHVFAVGVRAVWPSKADSYADAKDDQRAISNIFAGTGEGSAHQANAFANAKNRHERCYQGRFGADTDPGFDP